MMRTQMVWANIQSVLVPFLYCSEDVANLRSNSSCNKEHIIQCSCPMVEVLDMAARLKFK